jgi:methionine aminopeptidase
MVSQVFLVHKNRFMHFQIFSEASGRMARKFFYGIIEQVKTTTGHILAELFQVLGQEIIDIRILPHGFYPRIYRYGHILYFFTYHFPNHIGSAELHGFWSDNGNSFVPGQDKNNHLLLVEASRRILSKALSHIRRGVKVSAIGAVIQNEAKRQDTELLKTIRTYYRKKPS